MSSGIIHTRFVLPKIHQLRSFLGNAAPAVQLLQVRTTTNKHWNPKWKPLRRRKYMKLDLPDFNETNEDLTPDQIRSKMKERGLLPPRPWMERPFFISATGGIFEAYVPPEGDGKMSSITATGAKQKFEFLEKKSKSMMAIRKIKSFDDDFKTSDFCVHAQDIYIKAHEAMAKKDKLALREYVTERAYPEMRHNTLDKSIHWKFLKSLEPPKIVHARNTNVISQDNLYGQITVRFHSQQQLAVYDRFGRLMHGSEIIAKDVLEYVVFEKHLSNLYGKWRVHDKIIPDWMPPKEPSLMTHLRREDPDVGLSTEKQGEEPKEETAPVKVEGDGKPELATA